MMDLAKPRRCCSSHERKLARALHLMLGKTARRGGTGAFLWYMRRARVCTEKQAAMLRALALKWAARLDQDLVELVRSGQFEQLALREAFDASLAGPAAVGAVVDIGERAVALDVRMGAR